MKLSDMIEKKLAEQSPSIGQTRAAKVTGGAGVSATRLQRSDDIVSKRTDTASKDVAKQLKVYNFALSSDFSKSAQFAQMIELASKEMQAKAGQGNPEPDMTAMMQSAEFDDDSMLESKLQALNEFTSVQSIDNNLLLLMMGGDPVLTQQARIALKQIENDRGINKRFMPALRKLLSHLTDILADAGMAGYKVIDNLHATMSPEKHQINKDIKAGGDGPIDSDYEPSDEEISKYGIDNNVPTVTPDQKKAVRDTLKAKNAERGSEDDEGILVFGKKGKEGEETKDAKEKQKMAASKEYNENPLEEIKKLAGLSEDKGMPSKKHVMDMCKKGMSNAEMFKMHPEADKDKLKAMIDDCKEELKEGLGYAEPGEDSERVTYSKTKKMGDASITINANADSMKELHDVLKLAGIDFEDNGKHDDSPDQDDHEDHDSEEPGDKKPVMVIKPQDANYSTDKEVLVNYLKDKLKKSIS